MCNTLSNWKFLGGSFIWKISLYSISYTHSINMFGFLTRVHYFFIKLPLQEDIHHFFCVFILMHTSWGMKFLRTDSWFINYTVSLFAFISTKWWNEKITNMAMARSHFQFCLLPYPISLPCIPSGCLLSPTMLSHSWFLILKVSNQISHSLRKNFLDCGRQTL